MVVDGAAQVGQRLVEAVMRTAFWHIGPQQAGQGLAWMGTRHLDGQERQQGTHLAGLKGGDLLSVQQRLEGTHEYE